MNSNKNFLDVESDIMEQKLRFVKNKDEQELNEFLGFTEKTNYDNPNYEKDYKIVCPLPGLCLKCFKKNTNEKFFINLCQTDGILPPENISETELCQILQSEQPSTYRIPMSISEPRYVKDKYGNTVEACDIAINPKFFKKCEKKIIFRDFLIALILEAISEKYNIQLSDNWIILKNRKLMGTLISHRIENRDIKRVYNSYKNPFEKEANKKYLENSNEQKSKKQKKTLIEEIDLNEAEAIKNKSNCKSSCFKIYGKENYSKIYEIIAEFYLPNLESEKEISINVRENKITLFSLLKKYYFSEIIPYKINPEKSTSTFDPETKIVRIEMPLINEDQSSENYKQFNCKEELQKSQSVDSKTFKEQSNKKTVINERKAIVQFEEPKFKIYGKIKNSKMFKIIADIWLPKCNSSEEILFCVNENKLFVQAMKCYQLLKTLPHIVNSKEVTAVFIKESKVLQIQMPLVETNLS